MQGEPSKKIRIAYIVTNLRNTGPINQTYNLIQHLDKNVFEIYVITLWPENDGDSLLSKYENSGARIIKGSFNKKSSLVFGRKYVTSCLRKIRPDIVQGVGMPLYRMALKYKEAVPFVVLRNYCYEDYPSHYGNIIGNLMAKADIKLIKKQLGLGYPIITCSNSLVSIYYEKEGIRLDCIQNGVDTSRFTKRDIEKKDICREKLKLPKDKKIFVYSGRLIQRKNQEEAIKAFISNKINDNALLLILGDGPDRAMLEAISNGNKKIRFEGNVNEIEDYIVASDVYIATSKSEGLPNGVLEAMAVGLPVLLSDIPQHLEVMNNSNCGLTYKLGDVEDLINAINKIVFSDIEEMSEISYKTLMSNFTDVIMSNNYSNYYKRILGM